MGKEIIVRTISYGNISRIKSKFAQRRATENKKANVISIATIYV